MVKVDFQTDKAVLTPDAPVKQVIVYMENAQVTRVSEDKLHRLHITIKR